MAFNHNGGHAGHNQPMVEINTTPLVDVMLVLLVIFIITAPLINQDHAVPVDLPKASTAPADNEPLTVQVTLDGSNRIFVNGVETNMPLLDKKLQAVLSPLRPVPEVHLRADRHTPYERVVEVMAIAQGVGMSRIAFVTEDVR